MKEDIIKLKEKYFFKYKLETYNLTDSQLESKYKYFVLNTEIFKSHYQFLHLDFDFLSNLVFKCINTHCDYIYGKNKFLKWDNEYIFLSHIDFTIKLPIFFMTEYNSEYSIWMCDNTKKKEEILRKLIYEIKLFTDSLNFTFYDKIENDLNMYYQFNIFGTNPFIRFWRIKSREGEFDNFGDHYFYE